MEILLWAYVTLLGLLLGSFAALCAVRLPLGESIVTPRSHCRRCQHRLYWYENIPVLSYLFLRGRCGKCGEPIPHFYPVVEIITLGITLWAFHVLHPWPRFILYLLTFLVPMVILVLTDLKYFLLPDAITLPGIVVGCCVYVLDRYFWTHTIWGGSIGIWVLESLAGLLFGGVTLALLAFIYERWRGQAGMGGGDIKMAAMIGAFFGWKGIFFIFFLSSLLGLVLGVILILLRGGDRRVPIPYGVCLGIIGILYLFFGRVWEQNYFKVIRMILK